ncbi:glycosyltransferase family 1 protein [Microbacterium sp. ARD31]|uniref:glycosyltransferase family 4 protein n=1 Tax=Microbacterium sp. ARD31 TaxID=2962576 RepID=UPI0028820DA7|nr:glycosyltransferase family 1 protein [Microbacterium sp. ARD31]MDT0182964.1 glycosyltransferase family 1 protein [Microbacterium sp. ARD31]
MFDGYWWFRGPISNRMVQRQIIQTWAQEFPADDLVVAVPSHRSAEDVPDYAELLQVDHAPVQAALNLVHLPRLARRHRVDAIIAHNFAPRTAISATFIHDLMFMDHPEWFTRAENSYFRVMTASARRTRGHLVTSSQTEARRIERLCARQAIPVGLAISPELLETLPDAPAATPPSTFLLAVGRLNVRKNLSAAVEGCIESGTLRPDRPLVVVGEASGRHTSWSSGARRAIDDGRVRLLGPVSDAELSWLYRRADVFLMLSLDEGYGLPIAEAVGFGTPVLASDIEVFREEFGPHVCLVDPLDVRAIARVVAAQSPQRRAPATIHDWHTIVHRIRRSLDCAEAAA